MNAPGLSPSAVARPSGFWSLMRLGLWTSLAVSFVEVAGFLFVRFALGGVLHRSAHFPWMIPTAYVLLFSAPILLVAGLAQVLPEAHRYRPAAFSFAFLAVFAQLVTWLFFRLHPVALLVLAAGAAAQISRTADRRAAALDRLVRRSLPWGVAAVIVVALCSYGVRSVSQRRAIAALPAAAPGPSTSLLLLILDTVRAQNLSLYGYGRMTTPNLDAFARHGVVFDRAIAPSSWTLPSHASIFTGLPASELSANWDTPLDAAHPTIAGVLSEAGFATAGFVANRHYTTAEHGLARGFGHYDDYLVNVAEIIRTSGLGERIEQRWSLRPLIGTDQPLGRKSAGRVNQEFIAWLDGVGDRPFFAFLNYYDAHDPYLPPEPWKEKFVGDGEASRLSPYRRYPRDGLFGAVEADEVADEMDAYDGAIAYIDHEIGVLLDHLRTAGRLESTVIVVTSDHGELFGEHGLYLHGRSLYAPELHVPLVMGGAVGFDAPVRVPAAVSLVDLPATFLDLLDLDPRLPGQSMRPLWNTDDAPPGGLATSSVRRAIRIPDHYPAALGNIASAVFDGWHYIAHEDGTEELFDWSTDPNEERNRASDPAAVLRLGQGREYVADAGREASGG